MADLVADISEAEQRTIQAQKESSQNQHHAVSGGQGAASLSYGASAAAAGVSLCEDDLPPPPAEPMLDLPPPPPPPPPEPLSKVSIVMNLSLYHQLPNIIINYESLGFFSTSSYNNYNKLTHLY